MSPELRRANRRASRRVTQLRKMTGAAVAMMMATAAALYAQKNPYRNYTEEKFVQNMQTAGRNYAAVKEFVGKNDYQSAKAQLTRAREQLAVTITFWRDRNREDAVSMLRTALSGMDGLDAALGEEPAAPAPVAAAVQRLDAACAACHAVYRDQDPATKAFRVKPGVIR
jgi:cytochrome c556